MTFVTFDLFSRSNPISGFWNAVQQPHIYMNTLLVMHAVNISISLSLIFGVPALGVPALGVVGAGIGTAISVWVGTALYLRMGFTRWGCHHIRRLKR